MRPEIIADNVLSTTRARAKMHEFRVEPEDFNALPRNPAILFALAIGILGDIAATVADQIGGDAGAAPEELPKPLGWGETDADPRDALRFASIFFDAYLNAELDADLTSEFSLLCSAAYYIAGNVGSAAVIARHMVPPALATAGGLGYLLYAILRNEFGPIEPAHAHQAVTSDVLEALGRFFQFDGDASAVAEICDRMRAYFHKSGSARELLADSGDVARSFRDHVARCSDMMSPAWGVLLTVGF